MEVRVQKIIAAAGIASRRAAEELILDGRVKVNGAVVTELGSKADPDRDHIKVDGKLINPQQPKTYVMLNKPVGYVTTMSDPEGRQVVSNLLKGVRTRVYPVGRLDYNTEGLLLLTNDGDFAHIVTHPRHELPKTYLVKVKGVLEDRDIDNLERGVFLKDGKTAPARVRRLRKEEANSWVEITIHEGRKRQVRRMIDHTGKSVIKLKRTKIGSLDLGDLPLGTYRHLTLDEVKGLQEAAQGGEGRMEGRMMPGETVSVPSGPAGAKRQLTFIEGPKPKKRHPAAAAPRTAREERRPAKISAERRTTGERGTRERFGDGRTTRPVQRGTRPEGKRPWQEKRSEGAPFSGPKGAFGSRTARTGEVFKPRGGRGSSFGSRSTSPGQRAPRPEAKRPWQSEKRLDRPSFGGRAERPEGRKPWPEKRSARTPFGGPDRSSRSRAPRTGEGFKPREGQGRSFVSRSTSPGQRGARPEGRKPWPEKRSARTPFGGPDRSSRGSAPRTGEGFRQRGPRPEGARPWSAEKGTSRPGSRDSRPRTGARRSSGPKTGWARSGNDRDKKGRGRRRS